MVTLIMSDTPYIVTSIVPITYLQWNILSKRGKGRLLQNLNINLNQNDSNERLALTLNSQLDP